MEVEVGGMQRNRLGFLMFVMYLKYVWHIEVCVSGKRINNQKSVLFVVLGLGHYNITSAPTKLGGDLAGVNIVQVATYGDCCLAVSADGDLFGWGNSEYLQLASVTDSTQV